MKCAWAELSFVLADNRKVTVTLVVADLSSYEINGMFVTHPKTSQHKPSL